jgi:hypothetical protein
MPYLPRHVAITALIGWILLRAPCLLGGLSLELMPLAEHRAHLGAGACAAHAAFHVHSIASIAALALCPLVRSGQRGPIPVAYIGAAVTAAAAALLRAPHAWGGLVTQLGLSPLGLAWLTSSAAAAADHAVARVDDRWWVLSCALTTAAGLGAAQLDLLLAVGVPDALAYGIVAWASWLPQLVWWWRRRETWAPSAGWAYPVPAPVHRTPG